MVSEGQSIIIMAGGMATGRQAWLWRSSQELTSDPQVAAAAAAAAEGQAQAQAEAEAQAEEAEAQAAEEAEAEAAEEAEEAEEKAAASPICYLQEVKVWGLNSNRGSMYWSFFF